MSTSPNSKTDTLTRKKCDVSLQRGDMEVSDRWEELLVMLQGVNANALRVILVNNKTPEKILRFIILLFCQRFGFDHVPSDLCKLIFYVISSSKRLVNNVAFLMLQLFVV